jgi:radical SAM protein with 4Fe4S-binding SPASM domain
MKTIVLDVPGRFRLMDRATPVAPAPGEALVRVHRVGVCGSVFACDHYVHPEYRLGNVLTDRLGAMVERSVASGFEPNKETALPRWCRECEVLHACWGGCPSVASRPRLRGTWAALPVRRVQEVLPPHPKVPAGHDHLAGEWAAGVPRDGSGQGTAGDPAWGRSHADEGDGMIVVSRMRRRGVWRQGLGALLLVPVLAGIEPQEPARM